MLDCDVDCLAAEPDPFNFQQSFMPSVFGDVFVSMEAHKIVQINICFAENNLDYIC